MSYVQKIKMLLFEISFVVVNSRYSFYIVRTGVFGEKKKFLQKNINLCLFGNENCIFKVGFCFCYGFLMAFKTEKKVI